MGLPSAHRMTSPGQFAAVRAQGRARSGALMTVAFLAQPGQPGVRFGFTITKRIGNAVKRNFLRRRLREVSRATTAIIRGAGMLVTIPRPAAARASFQELQLEWLTLVGKLNLLPKPPPLPSPLPELL
jgi:ribonuclease P protein component